MSKTPEEMAQKYANKNCGGECQDDEPGVIKAFLAGYKAAQEHSHAALEEAEARIQELRDQLMEESGGRLRLFKDDADAKAAYQEALEEVDLDKAWQQGYKAAATEYQEKLNQMRLERPAFKKHEIENLLSQSNADGYKRGFERGLTAQKCWISVDEKLPENEEITVLVLISGDGWHDHDVAYCASGKWYDKYDDIVEGVTHWQELPEPPKEEK